MKVNVSLYNSETSDLAIMVDLLRASTTITIALNNFNRVIPVNTIESAFELKEKYHAILAGEKKIIKIDGFDVSNSPYEIQDYTEDTLILKSTNGTKVLENLGKNEKTKILIGSAINAKAVAQTALNMADEEIDIVMAGRHGKFTIEDCLGAGIIINEMIKLAIQEYIDLELTEFAQVAKMISSDYLIAKDLINSSNSADILRDLDYIEDIKICTLVNEVDTVPIYRNNEITKLEN